MHPELSCSFVLALPFRLPIHLQTFIAEPSVISPVFGLRISDAEPEACGECWTCCIYITICHCYHEWSRAFRRGFGSDSSKETLGWNFLLARTPRTLGVVSRTFSEHNLSSSLLRQTFSRWRHVRGRRVFGPHYCVELDLKQVKERGRKRREEKRRWRRRKREKETSHKKNREKDKKEEEKKRI